jgi:hypothetical protein
VAASGRAPGRILGVAALAALTIAGATVASHRLTDRSTPPARASDGRAADTSRSAPTPVKPDIFYIMLEEYGGASTLRNSFGYENEPFLEALRRRGFYVAERSTTNYPRTILSVASSLNMRYVDGLSERLGRQYVGQGPLADLIHHNVVGRTLQSAGYRWIQLGSWWQPTTQNSSADQNIRFTDESQVPDELFGRLVEPAEGRPFRTTSYGRVLFQFDALSKLADRPGPKFVFAHIVSPHAPYVFDRQGRYLPIEVARQREEGDNYVDQLIAVNRMVLDLVDRLLAVPAARRPVVIIQSDEGPFDGEPYSWQPVDPNQMARKFPILNAYYFPDGDRGDLYPTITPVNTFRLVFDHYLGRDLPMLPDRNFIFRNVRHLYALTDITPQVSGVLSGTGQGPPCVGGESTGCLARSSRGLLP